MALAGIFWGTNPVLVKLSGWEPYGMSWFRSLFCLALLLGYIFLNKKFSLRSLPLQFACGLFLALNSMLFVFGAELTSPANAVLLLFVFPWITMLLDFSILKRKPTMGGVQRSALGLLGVGVLVYGGLDTETGLGDLFALAAGCSVAFHIFFSQRLAEKHSGNSEVLSAIMFGWLASAIILIPFSDMASFPSGNAFYCLLAFAIFSAIPWLFWAKAVAYVPGSVMGALLGLEVFIAALLGWWWLDELPTVYTWVGGLLTLVAAASQIIVSSLPSSQEGAEKVV
jgi:drug/metabolite transporter (DMT)-like permease